jgi:hypothetical protein
LLTACVTASRYARGKPIRDARAVPVTLGGPDAGFGVRGYEKEVGQ